MSTRSKSQKQEEKQSSSQASMSAHTPLTPNSANGEKDFIKSTRLSRLDEKNTLISLNNRLAAIIERNQQLEFENTQLTIQVESAEETLKVTTKTINDSIGKENAEIRKQLLDSENEKSKAILLSEKLKKSLDEANQKIQRHRSELDVAKKQTNGLRDELASVKLELEKQRFENAQLSALNKSLESEVKKLSDDNAKNKKHGDELSILNSQLQNELKSKSAELAQKMEFHSKEVTALRSFNQKKIEEVGEKLGKDYETNLQKVIQALRAECEKQILSNKQEQENLFKIKEADMMKQNENINGALRAKTTELLTAEKMLQTTRSKMASLEKERDFLQGQLKSLTENLNSEGEGYRRQLEELERQIKQLQEEKIQVINDYQDLMETKVALDNEIATYRKLLEGEEERLNLSMEAKRSSRKRQWSSK